MRSRLKLTTGVFAVGLVVLAIAMLAWMARRPARPDDPAPDPAPVAGSPSAPPPLRLALVPERDIFEQRRRYRALAEHLGGTLGRSVELCTLNTYQGVLDDFAARQIDGAFLGSMVAVLACDRLGCRVVVKPVHAGGVSTYRGVLFVRSDAPYRAVEDLAGRSIAMVRTTTAGNLFPTCLLRNRGMLHGADRPVMRWVGTHDDVIREVVGGSVDAGAAKDLRLDAWESGGGQALRRLAVGAEVPNNALVLRPGLDERLGARLAEILIGMDETEAGRVVLAALGAERFVPCDHSEYAAIYERVEELGDDWNELGVAGPPPVRPGPQP